ncbi:MAG: ATP-binding protein [Methylococcales bacterium]
MQFDTERILCLGYPGVSEEPKIEVARFDKVSGQNNNHYTDWEKVEWINAKNEWHQAHTRKGIITQNGLSKIQLWRASLEVPGYPCLVSHKRDQLRKLIRELKSPYNSRHTAYMVIAAPGSGKSFLVKQIAKAICLHLVSFNLSQLLKMSELLDCFDTIVQTQHKKRGERLLVFIDEFNVILEQRAAIELFLAPLEDGVYRHGEKTFLIEPCTWIFVGSALPTQTSKLEDFKSRMSLPVLNFNDVNATQNKVQEYLRRLRNNVQKNLARLENVYVTVSLIQTAFPEVVSISKNALDNIYDLAEDTIGPRELRKFVQGFKEVRNGEISTLNFPDKEMSLGESLASYKSEPEPRGEDQSLRVAIEN